jgi:hypothetical protein
MTAEQTALLRQMAERYIWWKSAQKSIESPHRIAAQVMNIRDYDDAQKLASTLGDEFLRSLNAEIGEFNERSWHYWHFRLGLAKLCAVPDLPARKLA